jgi:glutathione S-transferase
MLKLYADPISTTSRAVLSYLKEQPVEFELVPTSLYAGEHLAPEFAALNPSKAVPVLTDGDFTLTECSAILKYLAELPGAGGYPQEAKARARVNQAMDWLNTGFYREFGYGLVYPQVFPQYAHPNAVTHADVLRRGRERAAFWLEVLDTAWLKDKSFLCGSAVSIADHLGAAYVSIGDWIDFDLSAYPNVQRWMRAMRARPSWFAVNGAWDALTAQIHAQRSKAA